MNVSVGDSWDLPSMTATDNVDGDVTASVELDKSSISSFLTSGTSYTFTSEGTYTITYSVTDEAGNIGTYSMVITVSSTDEIDWTSISYYSSLTDSGDITTDLALLLRSTINYVSYGDARYIYVTDSETGYQYVLYDTSETEVPLTWGDGGNIDTDGDGTADYYVDREHIWACNDMRIMPEDGDRTLDTYTSFVLNTDTDAFDDRPDNTSRGHYSDLFNLWLAVRSVNQTLHSDYYYGETGTTGDPNTSDDDIFYPGDEYKGDIARSLLYMSLMYPYLTLVNEGDANAVTGSVYYGYLDILLEWNREDPVSEEEIMRNQLIYETQGNRNPFIDFYNEDIATLIYGNGDPNVLDSAS